jgi:hypothetical protein
MKRISIVILVLVIASLFGANIAAAQEPEQEEGRSGRRGGRAMMFEIISEATGLNREALHEALQEDGATLASVIEDNGGDVDAIIDQIVAAIVERTDGDATEIEARITEKFNTPHEAREGRRGPRGGAAPAFEGDDV